jgi:hypothetical protein
MITYTSITNIQVSTSNSFTFSPNKIFRYIKLFHLTYSNSGTKMAIYFSNFSFTGTQLFQATNLAVTGTTNLTGNVSIGTTTQRAGCILTVNGKIAAEEFEIVTDVNTPDYVFDKTYKLRSLKELETYVNTYSHLPEVPSAADMKQNGYKVVQMDNLLLKKIEELSLYTIELNKQVESLKAELSKVKEGK